MDSFKKITPVALGKNGGGSLGSYEKLEGGCDGSKE